VERRRPAPSTVPKAENMGVRASWRFIGFPSW
jgi:hypothetical protein